MARRYVQITVRAIIEDHGMSDGIGDYLKGRVAGDLGASDFLNVGELDVVVDVRGEIELRDSPPDAPPGSIPYVIPFL